MGRWLDRAKEPERREGQDTGPRLEPGCPIRWRSMDGKERGPAVVEEVAESGGICWVWVEYADIGRWVSETIITQIEQSRHPR